MKKTEKLTVARDIWSVGRQIIGAALTVRPKAVLLYLAGGLLETLASILTIYASAKLAGLLAAYVSTGQTDGIWFWLYVDIVAAVLIGIGFWIMSYADRLLYFAMNKWAVDNFMGVMSRIPIADFYDETIRNDINKAEQNHSWVIPNATYMYLQLIYGLIRLVAISIVVAQIQPWLLLIIVICLIPSLLSDAKQAGVQWLIWGSKGDIRHVFRKLTTMLAMPKEQMELRSMQAQTYAQTRLREINSEFLDEQENRYKSLTKLTLSSKIVSVGGVAIGSVILLRQFLGGAIALDRYFFLSGALLRIVGALNSVFGTLSSLQEPLLYAKDFLKLVHAYPETSPTTSQQRLVIDNPPTIEFKNVTFTYPNQSKPVFNKLNLIINSGEHVALVGENGAGKSTIIKLLLKFYEPDSGEILINDIPLASIAIESWYAQLATLFQDFNQYPFPIDENIFIGRPDQKPDRSKVDEAAHFGGVDTLVKSYKHGYETVLDASFKKGVEPSGGQWQRIALARAFYRDANILILDEPTSAIDAKAEYDIFNKIFTHYQDRSAIIVSHRFSTVRRANRIIVMEAGKIVEQGSHKALMKNKGLYHELFSKQAEGYKN